MVATDDDASYERRLAELATPVVFFKGKQASQESKGIGTFGRASAIV